MRPILVLAGTFLSLSLSQLFAAELSWLSFDDALTKARAERHVILVELRGCPQAAEGQETPKCHPPSAETTAKISSSPILAKAMRDFIRARVEVGKDNSPNISYLLAQGPPIPAAALVDPSGTIVATWRLDDASIHLNNLNVARKNKAPMLKSYDLRAKGAHREADLLLGDVNLTMGHAHKALKIYERTIVAFDTAGEADRARATRLRIENVRHLLGRQRVAIAEAERLLRDASPAVAAEGYLIIGEMYARDKAQALAVDAYRRALEIAPAGSPHSVTARRALLRLGETTDVPAATGASSVRIIGATRTSVSGRAEFSAVAPPETERVLWYIDGQHVATASNPPFTALLRFGNTPRPYQLRAVAFGANGKGIARATQMLNDRLDQPRIAISSPVETTVAGPVMLEADSYVPPTMALESVQFFWNGEEIGAFTAPPFRQQFPAPSSFGYFRALLTLKDGQTAEDALVFNTSGFGETLDVHTIAFAATVLDAKGKHLTKLNPGDFAAFDQNAPVALKVRDPGSEPGTVGVAIDVSSSMAPHLLSEIETVSRLIDVVGPTERVFVSAFDSQPRLLHPATTNRDVLKDKIFDLNAEGSTAAADALAFALQQFNGLSGRRALVLITDGHENASEQNTRDCMELARQSGVPLYVIVPRGAAKGAEPFRRVLAEMAEITGGLFFDEPSSDQIPAILNRIRDDVRSQYLLAFDATGSGDPGTWRKVRVEIANKRATVRTIGGYYTR